MLPALNLNSVRGCVHQLSFQEDHLRHHHILRFSPFSLAAQSSILIVGEWKFDVSLMQNNLHPDG